MKVGTRLAAVALYHGSTEEDSWSYFMPTIVQCCIHDPHILAAVMVSIPRSEWNQLDQFLGQLEDHRVGMYKMWMNGKFFSTGGVTKFAEALIPLGVAIAVALVLPPALKQAAEKKAKENPAAVMSDEIRVAVPGVWKSAG